LTPLRCRRRGLGCSPVACHMPANHSDCRYAICGYRVPVAGTRYTAISKMLRCFTLRNASVISSRYQTFACNKKCWQRYCTGGCAASSTWSQSGLSVSAVRSICQTILWLLSRLCCRCMNIVCVAGHRPTRIVTVVNRLVGCHARGRQWCCYKTIYCNIFYQIYHVWSCKYCVVEYGNTSHCDCYNSLLHKTVRSPEHSPLRQTRISLISPGLLQLSVVCSVRLCYAKGAQSAKNAAARLVISSRRRDHITQVLRQMHCDEFESGGHRSGAKVWGTDPARRKNFFWSFPSTFLLQKAQLVVLVSAFVMVSTV